MKRFLLIVCLIMITANLFASYTVNTSQGEKTLVVPEGYTLEEAYCKMAELYWEERYANEKLIEDSAIVSSEIKGYVAKVEKMKSEYDVLLEQHISLEKDYQDMVKLLNSKAIHPRFLLGTTYSNSFNGNDSSVGAMFGVQLFSRFSTMVMLSPKSWGIGLTMTL